MVVHILVFMYREASQSDNETMRYLVDLLVILKKNLVKAEAEVFRKKHCMFCVAGLYSFSLSMYIYIDTYETHVI